MLRPFQIRRRDLAKILAPNPPGWTRADIVPFDPDSPPAPDWVICWVEVDCPVNPAEA